MTNERRRKADDLWDYKFQTVLDAIADLKKTLEKKFNDYDRVCTQVTQHEENIKLIYGFMFGGFTISAITIALLKVVGVL